MMTLEDLEKRARLGTGALGKVASAECLADLIAHIRQRDAKPESLGDNAKLVERERDAASADVKSLCNLVNRLGGRLVEAEAIANLAMATGLMHLEACRKRLGQLDIGNERVQEMWAVEAQLTAAEQRIADVTTERDRLSAELSHAYEALKEFDNYGSGQLDTCVREAKTVVNELRKRAEAAESEARQAKEKHASLVQWWVGEEKALVETNQRFQKERDEAKEYARVLEVERDHARAELDRAKEEAERLETLVADCHHVIANAVKERDELASLGELAPLRAEIAKGREKYPNGCTVLSLIDEAGEVAHAVNKYESAVHVREEILQTAAVAMRLYLGEVDTGLEIDGLVQRRIGALVATPPTETSKGGTE